MDLKYPELENGQEYLPKYLMLKDRIIEVSEEEIFCRRPNKRNFAMSSGGSVATAVKIEELDSGVQPLFVTVTIGITISISVNRIVQNNFIFISNFRKVSCLRKTNFM
jgi:hypothetical protein